jgi:hypothetical protein
MLRNLLFLLKVKFRKTYWAYYEVILSIYWKEGIPIDPKIS